VCISRANRRTDKEGKKSTEREKSARKDSQRIQRLAHKEKKKEIYKMRKGQAKINSEIKGKQKAVRKEEKARENLIK
jgi:hypothetical protein